MKQNLNKNTETRRERFKRIAERRVNTILDNLDSLGKCSNKKYYEYTDKDVRKIFNELNNKIKEIKSLYKNKNNKKIRFEL